MWLYFGIRELLLMEKYSHWLSQPYLCDFVFSNHSNHSEFYVKFRVKLFWHIRWVVTSQSTWTSLESTKIRNSYHGITLLPQIWKISSFWISHRIQSEIANTSVGCHTRRVSTPQSTWTCLGSIKIRNNYHENTISQRYLHSEFHIESHRIQSEMKWIRMAHTLSLRITDHLKLFGKHQYPKQLPWEYFLAGNQKDIITLNFT